MIHTVLFFLHSALLLIFGIMASLAFSGIRYSRKNTAVCLLLFALCGGLQLYFYFVGSEDLVRQLYPLITHLPIVLVLWLGYRKTFVSAFAAVCTGYLCCQPAKWFGILASHLTHNPIWELVTTLVALPLTGSLAIVMLASCLSNMFGKEDRKSVFIFGITPIVYYCYDYIVGVYARDWIHSSPIALEFLAFFLCVVFLMFCSVYYKEYEQKADAERKEQILRITAEQQAKEVETVRRSSQEVRLLRHDMRLLLSTLATALEDDNPEKAKELISAYTSLIDGTKQEYFCENDTINYVLSDFAAKCRQNHIDFHYTVELPQFRLDEMLFCSVLSNALDNALNAQLMLPRSERKIKLMLKHHEDKLLLSVKNPVFRMPQFVDGMPVTTRKNHGYGTQSIRFMTEKLGGNCQFSVQDGQFLVRVVL